MSIKACIFLKVKVCKLYAKYSYVSSKLYAKYSNVSSDRMNLGQAEADLSIEVCVICTRHSLNKSFIKMKGSKQDNASDSQLE